MNDSLIIAKLTVMLLRASIADADSLRAACRVLLTPGTETLSLDEALERISELRGLFTFSAEARDGDLVIAFEKATPEDEIEVRHRMEIFSQGWRVLNANDKANALVEARGFDESLLVPMSVVEAWLRFANCRTCSLRVFERKRDSPAGVVAVLDLGSARRTK